MGLLPDAEPCSYHSGSADNEPCDPDDNDGKDDNDGDNDDGSGGDSKPGRLIEPDGSQKDAQQQLEGLEDSQQHDRKHGSGKAVEHTDKSEQNLQKSMDQGDFDFEDNFEDVGPLFDFDRTE